MLGSQIDDNVANSIVSQLFLQAQDAEKDIYLYINSPGGSVTLLVMIQSNTSNQMYKRFVLVWLRQWVHFYLQLVQGKRFALNAEVMIHQPLGGAQVQATEIEIAANHILKHAKLNQILAERTGQSIEKN